MSGLMLSAAGIEDYLAFRQSRQATSSRSEGLYRDTLKEFVSWTRQRGIREEALGAQLLVRYGRHLRRNYVPEQVTAREKIVRGYLAYCERLMPIFPVNDEPDGGEFPQHVHADGVGADEGQASGSMGDARSSDRVDSGGLFPEDLEVIARWRSEYEDERELLERAIVWVIASTGVMPVELCRLVIADCSEDATTLLLGKGTSRARIAEMTSDEAVDALCAYLDWRLVDARGSGWTQQPLFVDSGGGKIEVREVGEIVRARSSAAGYGDSVTPRKMREAWLAGQPSRNAEASGAKGAMGPNVQDLRRLLAYQGEGEWELLERAVVGTLASTGMGEFDLRLLDRSDFNADAATLSVRKENDQTSEFKLRGCEGLAALQDYLRDRDADEGIRFPRDPRKGRADKALFVGSEGTRISSTEVREIVQRRCSAAGIGEHVSPSALRYAFALSLVDDGHGVKTVLAFVKEDAKSGLARNLCEYWAALRKGTCFDADIVERYLVRRRRQGLVSEGSARRWLRNLACYIEWAAMEGANAVGASELAAYGDYLESSYAPSTAVWRYATLADYLGFCEDEGVLGFGVGGGAAGDGWSSPRVEVSDDELRAVLAYRGVGKRELVERAVFALIADGGVRASQLSALDVGDYDGELQVLSISDGVFGVRRVKIVRSDGVRAMNEYLRARFGDSQIARKRPQALFLGRSGNRISEHEVSLIVQRRCAEAGIRGRVTPDMIHMAGHKQRSMIARM